MFGPRVCCSRQEGLSGVGLVHQSLHRDAHFHQALLFQDMVRKTQFVLGVQNRREGGMDEKRWKRMDRNGMEMKWKKKDREKREERSLGANERGRKERKVGKDLDAMLIRCLSASMPAFID